MECNMRFRSEYRMMCAEELKQNLLRHFINENDQQLFNGWTNFRTFYFSSQPSVP